MFKLCLIVDACKRMLNMQERGALLRENMIINCTVAFDSFRGALCLGKLQVVTAVDFSID